jgi:hypothetical protein
MAWDDSKNEMSLSVLLKAPWESVVLKTFF